MRITVPAHHDEEDLSFDVPSEMPPSRQDGKLKQILCTPVKGRKGRPLPPLDPNKMDRDNKPDSYDYNILMARCKWSKIMPPPEFIPTLPIPTGKVSYNTPRPADTGIPPEPIPN